VKYLRYDEAILKLSDREFLDKLYGFAYKRSNTSFEAEDLFSDIILAVIKSLHKTTEIENFYGFVWSVAHRVYADYCEKRSKHKFVNYTDEMVNVKAETVEELIEKKEDLVLLNNIMREISFLSKIYRDVMVMHYIDGLSVSDISKRLQISETAVKQRLFSARNTIKKERVKMVKNLTLKPVDIKFIGTGNPVGNDPREKAERILSKSIIYLCKKEALTAKDISDELSVPMPFIEDELEILVHGANGKYGLLRKLDNGKYISNIVVLDFAEFKEAANVYTEALDEFCNMVVEYFESNKEKIENFPFLSPKKDISFIAWSLISPMVWSLERTVNKYLANRYMSDIEILKRDYTLIGIAHNMNEPVNLYFYGCDGLGAENLCGYKSVVFQNIYGARMDKHYDCEHNLSTEPQFMMLLRSIKGLDITTLNENEKEIAAKAIESGLIEKNGNTLRPKILVMKTSDNKDFYSLTNNFDKNIEPLCDKIAEKLSKVIKKQVPKHLLNEYPILTDIATMPLLHHTIEKCIEKGILKEPESRLCAEGSCLYVKE